MVILTIYTYLHQELKGLMAVYHTAVQEINYPLCCLIDYRGFRLVAMSILPISSTTIGIYFSSNRGLLLVYGSSDAGATTHDSDKILRERVEWAAQKLNLKKHIGGVFNTQELFMCTDIEGHLGKDGNRYLLDFARVLPPETPTQGYN